MVGDGGGGGGGGRGEWRGERGERGGERGKRGWKGGVERHSLTSFVDHDRFNEEVSYAIKQRAGEGV